MQNNNSSNITPIFSKLIERKEKEQRLNQKSLSIWFIGLSGSGKSTLAVELEKYLFHHQFTTVLLDGDNVRTGINKDLGFSIEDRKENIRRIAEINKLFIENGIIVINSFVCPAEELRTLIRSIVGYENVFFIYTKASLETCIQRDVKGLYKKAQQGNVAQFTGISAPFEEPLNPDLIVDTEKQSIEDCLNQIIMNIIPRITNESR